MAIEALSENVVAQIRSSFTIDSITQCVTELVLNSLDAKATAIAVRINCSLYKIQVVDNGKGISRPNLELVGRRYMTNKCNTLSDLKKRTKYYGFKGESLASIAKISQRVTITTRPQNCDESYEKIIEKDCERVDPTKNRPSFGTTVTIDGFLCSLPVRQQCIKSSELELVKRNIECLVIIHPGVSFTLRNDASGKMILASVKSQDVAGSFKTIHPNVDEKGFALIKVSKSKTSVEGLIHKELDENKRLQYIYVNKRPINCPKLHGFINSHLRKGQVRNEPKKKHPIYVIHIKCPYSDVDISLETTKTTVFFKKLDVVQRCVEKMINTFLGKENVSIEKKKTRAKQVASEFGVSQIGGAVKGIAKRKSEEIEEIIPTKSSKIIEDTPFLEEEPNVNYVRQTKSALPIEIIRNDKKDVNNDIDNNNSLFTNFPENEQRGKDMIMDMFIMSLQVFPKADKTFETGVSNSVVAQEECVSEQNNDGRISVGIQASINQDPPTKMFVSVGVQTDFCNAEAFIDNNDFSFFPRRPSNWFVPEYDCDFSKIESVPAFHFNKNYMSNFPALNNFNQTKKLFDFQKIEAFNNRNETFISHAPGYCGLRNETIVCNDQKFNDFKMPSQRNKCRSPSKDIKKSPYFGRKVEDKSRFSPAVSSNADEDTFNQTNSTRHNSRTVTCNDFSTVNDLNQIGLTFIKKSAKKSLNESTTSKFFTRVSPKCYLKKNIDNSKDLFISYKSTQNKIESNIIITLDDRDKRKIMDHDLQHERELPRDFESAQSEFNKDEVNLNDKQDFTFEIRERYEFVPKGLSPILRDIGTVPELSPGGKINLQNAVIQSYDDDLLLVKWQNCIDHQDPRQFFEQIYREKSKLIEGSIPNINKTGYDKQITRNFENMSFTKSLFDNMSVIGQVDCKFIAVLEKTKKLLVLFDQHAVHERVRLEELTKGYKNVSTKLDQDITIFLPCNDLKLLGRQKSALSSLGLVLTLFSNGITIHQVPLCIYNKSKKGADILGLTQTLIKEIVESLKDNHEILVNTPRVIQNIVNSEACRGAIKFGDHLSKNECFVHLKMLGNCNLPFQCAHGRPTLTPLLTLDKIFDLVVSKPRLNLLHRKNI